MSQRLIYPLWRLLPGLLVYNLIGRHLLYWRLRREWPGLPKPGRITLADIRWLRG